MGLIKRVFGISVRLSEEDWMDVVTTLRAAAAESLYDTEWAADVDQLADRIEDQLREQE